jgi:hypothetical protein
LYERVGESSTSDYIKNQLVDSAVGWANSVVAGGHAREADVRQNLQILRQFGNSEDNHEKRFLDEIKRCAAFGKNKDLVERMIIAYLELNMHEKEPNTKYPYPDPVDIARLTLDWVEEGLELLEQDRAAEATAQ